MLTLPKEQRLPVASHWGVTGGDLPKLVGPDFFKLDFAVVQTYSFINDPSPLAQRVVSAHNRLFGTTGARGILSQVGVAHAYDLTHLLARAVNKAGSTDRKAIRDALEKTGPYNGLVRKLNEPFNAARHDALSAKDIFMAKYAEQDGSLEKLPRR
jgi:branched-chain amino acid transport system substrate-binding protein